MYCRLLMFCTFCTFSLKTRTQTYFLENFGLNYYYVHGHKQVVSCCLRPEDTQFSTVCSPQTPLEGRKNVQLIEKKPQKTKRNIPTSCRVLQSHHKNNHGMKRSILFCQSNLNIYIILCEKDGNEGLFVVRIQKFKKDVYILTGTSESCYKDVEIWSFSKHLSMNSGNLFENFRQWIYLCLHLNFVVLSFSYRDKMQRELNRPPFT